jgi:ParB family chromosome partitioning protein
MESFGFNQDELSERVGKKRSTIANYLRLLTLPKSIQDSLSSEEITMGHAKAILSLEGFERQSALHDMILKEGLSVRATEEAASTMAYQLPPKPTATPNKKPAEKSIYIQQIESKLQLTLGTKVDIQTSGNKGKISIDYYNLDDLDRLLELMNPSKDSD